MSNDLQGFTTAAHSSLLLFREYSEVSNSALLCFLLSFLLISTLCKHVIFIRSGEFLALCPIHELI